MSDLKKQNHELLERVHQLQNELADSEMRRHELENQLRNANTVGVRGQRCATTLTSRSLQLLVQRQESEQEAIQKIALLTTDKQALQERSNTLQRQMGNLDIEKREAERSKLRLEKDKNVLRKTLDKVSRSPVEFLSRCSRSLWQVERERVFSEDMIRSWDRAEIDRQFRRVDEENQSLMRQVENLQCVLNESEQQHAQR